MKLKLVPDSLDKQARNVHGPHPRKMPIKCSDHREIKQDDAHKSLLWNACKHKSGELRQQRTHAGLSAFVLFSFYVKWVHRSVSNIKQLSHDWKITAVSISTPKSEWERGESLIKIQISAHLIEINSSNEKFVSSTESSHRTKQFFISVNPLKHRRSIYMFKSPLPANQKHSLSRTCPTFACYRHQYQWAEKKV